MDEGIRVGTSELMGENQVYKNVAEWTATKDGLSNAAKFLFTAIELRVTKMAMAEYNYISNMKEPLYVSFVVDDGYEDIFNRLFDELLRLRMGTKTRTMSIIADHSFLKDLEHQCWIFTVGIHPKYWIEVREAKFKLCHVVQVLPILERERMRRERLSQEYQDLLDKKPER